MALCGVGVGAEKNQFCAVIAQDNRVTGQVNVNQTGKGDDVFAEHIRLRFTGRQKNLVMTGFQGAQQRLAGKIKRRANLAGFQDTHQRPEAAKAEGKTETQKERKTPARTGAPESETGHAEESAKSTGSARR